jgi:hypothetical protein
MTLEKAMYLAGEIWDLKKAGVREGSAEAAGRAGTVAPDPLCNDRLT